MRDLCGSFVLEVRERVRRRDLLLLAVAPVAIVLAFFLPYETKVALAFRPSDPGLVSAFASHYVHLGAGHLLSNLVGYLLLAPLAALFCLMSGDRTSFYAAVPTFLLAFPVALSGLELALGIGGAAVGFSGINTAFFGLFVYALAQYADARVTDRVAAGRSTESAPLLFFVGLAIIAIIAVPLSVESVGIAVAAVLSALLYAEVGESPDLSVQDTVAEGGHLDLAGGGVGLFVAYPFLAFPVGATSGAGTVNLFTHLLGFCLAFIVVYVTALVRA